jgi:hypothetical protein
MEQKILTRAVFNALPQRERRQFITSGGAVSDPPPAPAVKISDPNVMTRQEFSALTPPEQLAAVRAGRRIVDGERAV